LGSQLRRAGNSTPSFWDWLSAFPSPLGRCGRYNS